MLPRITVVTCSYNQGQFIGRTIDSVLNQAYPNIEHIIVDGLSTDDTPAVLARYPHLRIIREADRGQADAINKGFSLSTGEILCFLNSDDLLLPGTLHRVAREIDPRNGRHVVMGRCIHIDENDVPTGVEHPSSFTTHERVLEVWKGHWIPQPATFWTREAWDRCGPLDVEEQLVLDYDLMCRLSRHYRFHFIDRAFAAYRLHTQSKTCSHTSAHIYAEAIRASRRYWGSPLTLRYWRLMGSLVRHRLDEKTSRRQRAGFLALMGRKAWANGKKLRGLACSATSTLLAPGMAFRRFQRRQHSSMAAWAQQELSPRTLIYRDFTELHGDQVIGPTFVTTFRADPGQCWLLIDGTPVLGSLPTANHLDVCVDGKHIGRYRLPGGRRFTLAVPVENLPRGIHEIQLRSDSFVVVSDYFGFDDDRPLAFQLDGIRPAGESVAVDRFTTATAGAVQ